MKRRFALLVAAAGLAAVLVMGGIAAQPSWRSRLQEAVPAPWLARLNQWRYGYRVDHDVRIAMPDGVRLAASLYLPKERADALPAVLVRLPYHRRHYGEGLGAGSFFARNGYAVLVVDLRGTGDSEGEFVPYEYGTQDGAAVLDWIVQQRWSNGRVGTFGCSALGETQFVLARAGHPAHAALFAAGAGGGLGRLGERASYGGNYEGGVFDLASGFGWFVKHGHKNPQAPPLAPFDVAATLHGLPSGSLVQRIRPLPNGYDDYIATPPGDPRWRRLDYFSDGDVLKVPSLVINSWGDQTVGDTLALAEATRATAREQHVVIAPGDHCEHREAGESGRFGDIEVRGAAQPYAEWALRWYDRWLRDHGDGLAQLPPYLYYAIGEDRWSSADRWPPAQARLQRWALSSGGHANGSGGDGQLQPPDAQPVDAALDEYRYDPADPVPSRGGPVCCTGNPAEQSGPRDQRPIESRSDLLVYTSAPLTRPLRIAGPLRARLSVSSSARDTDFVARLVDVGPDGRAIGMQEGALRARYRGGLDHPRPLVPGEVTTVEIDMRAIAWTLPAGHRLRLHVTSSSFPRLERNLNTGGDNHAEASGVVAVNRVHHDGEWPSFVELYVLPND